MTATEHAVPPIHYSEPCRRRNKGSATGWSPVRLLLEPVMVAGILQPTCALPPRLDRSVWPTNL